MIARHGVAMTAFSAVTVAYHMFFVVWLFAELIGGPYGQLWQPLTAAVIVFLLGLVLSFLDNRDWLVLSVLVYALSLTTFAMIGISPLKTIAWDGAQSHHELAWLTPVIVFGFLLCPYLDLTFHRAIQNSPSRNAFALFGIAFFVMILLTCVIWFPRSDALRGIALAHILAQIVFTVGAHLREIRVSPAIHNRERRWLIMAAPLLAAPLLFIARMFSDAGALGEDLYLRFLVFYGLVFPAYVLLFTKFSHRTLKLTRRGVAMYATIVLLSIPFYELGFLHQWAWLLVFPIGVMMLMALLPIHTATVTYVVDEPKSNALDDPRQ